MVFKEKARNYHLLGHKHEKSCGVFNAFVHNFYF